MEPVLQAESDGIKAEADLKRAKYAHSTTLAQGKNLKTAKDARAELTAALFELAKLQMVREQNAQGSNERVEEMRLKRAVHEQRTMELRYRMSLTGGPPPPPFVRIWPFFQRQLQLQLHRRSRSHLQRTRNIRLHCRPIPNAKRGGEDFMSTMTSVLQSTDFANPTMPPHNSFDEDGDLYGDRNEDGDRIVEDEDGA
ncbi:hypothetical protein SERLA73DRAFT_69473 [Serpula lacrymans var. lacrymans S7.3]|uniref:Uncharacterized protein n=1 Tax=Serpula lacrymans var. lacrymans (strain S7.3) TaxID=936435 RepID=F8PKY1_SERL3|nr:hypothetical protein SERLA73DRAFT_69473 [Serpula lacrymans var. lacrymans S7.3]